MAYSLKNKVVVITGSSGGLGAAAAQALAKKGARLALFDLREQDATAQAKGLGASVDAKGWGVDVCSLESVAAAMAAAKKHFGRIDIVIANAGIGLPCRVVIVWLRKPPGCCVH